jgi:hypothetical protein
MHRDFAAAFADHHRDRDSRAAAARSSSGRARIMGAIAGAYGIEVLAPSAASPFDRAARRRGESNCRSARGRVEDSTPSMWQANARKLVHHVATPIARQAASVPRVYSSSAAVQMRDRSRTSTVGLLRSPGPSSSRRRKQRRRRSRLDRSAHESRCLSGHGFRREARRRDGAHPLVNSRSIRMAREGLARGISDLWT